ncbi:hypothetical protein PNOK_0709400 [Pyrrhoderma noxium]|uniref:Uncharacterized protein n=1 Tax=Pyrrhoderma noxium TaxID=2282107 RepID=A0A286UBT1_9AGAM|nr:hypothetical protein PNOK_0709400 [Pyrrhoderma noxium]
MTYVALAKSLGLSLKKSTSYSTSSTTASPELNTGSGNSVVDTPQHSQFVESITEKYDRDNASDQSSSSKHLEIVNPCTQKNKISIAKTEEGVPEEGHHEDNTVSEAELRVDFEREGDIEGGFDIPSSHCSSSTTQIKSNFSVNPNPLDTDPDIPFVPESFPFVSSSSVSPCTNIINDNSNTITDEQLHRAKTLVLDLLGWGVPPEYLLQRGVSLSLLYTVFTDLRLRLPDSIFSECIELDSSIRSYRFP